MLGSSKKSLGGPSGPKLRKAAVRSTCRDDEKEKDVNSKQSEFSGKNLCDDTIQVFETLGFTLI